MLVEDGPTMGTTVLVVAKDNNVPTISCLGVDSILRGMSRRLRS